MTEPTPNLPRLQQGPRSQQLLTVLLGDYWFARSEPLPSAALVELMSVFDVTPSGARAAIQRLAQRGVLYAVKEGRQTSYGVPEMTQERINTHVVSLFRSHLRQDWDGTWTLVAYSLPDAERDARRALRETLRQLRFGPLYDGLWIRPGDHGAIVERDLSDHRAHLTVFTDAHLADHARAVPAAFGLDDVADAYRDFIATWEDLGRRLDEVGREGVIGLVSERSERPGDEALRLRTDIMREWRMLRRSDPHLPHELLSEDFPMHRAVEVCAAVYDSLGPLAEAAFRRMLERYRDDLAPLVTHHTFAASSSLLATT